MADPYIGYAAVSILCLTCASCYFRKKRQNGVTQPDLILITQEQFDSMNSVIKIQPTNNINVDCPPPKYSKNKTESESESEFESDTMKTPLLKNEYTEPDDCYIEPQNSV